MATSRGHYPVCLIAISPGPSPRSRSSASAMTPTDKPAVQWGGNQPNGYSVKKSGHLQDFSSQVGASGVIIDHQKGLVITTLLPFTDFFDAGKHGRQCGGQSGHQTPDDVDALRIREALGELSISVILPAQAKSCKKTKPGLHSQILSQKKQLNFGSSFPRDGGACMGQGRGRDSSAQIRQANGFSLGPWHSTAGAQKDDMDNPRTADTQGNDSLVVCKAKVALVWRCQALDDELRRLLPRSDGWALDYADKFDEIGSSSSDRGHHIPHRGNHQPPEEKGEIGKEVLGDNEGRRGERGQANFVSWFCLLQIDGGLPAASNSRLRITSQIHIGQPVVACGTPFATLTPSVFLNSLSSGIITKMSGSDSSEGVLVMTDARCMPGMEGGGLFVDEWGQSALAAIIVSPLCWKSNEWVGLTLACSASVLVESLSHKEHFRVARDSQSFTLPEIITGQRSMANDIIEHGSLTCDSEVIDGSLNWGDNEVSTKLADGQFRRDSLSNHLQRWLPSVVLVRIGSVWGSGVIVNAQHRLVLTCRHVVKNAAMKRISVKTPSQPWMKAELVYATSEISPLDLALLKIVDDPRVRVSAFFEAPMSSSCLEGSRVCAVGYPLFEPSKTTTPSITSGIVSKVVTLDGRPVMIQSSCAVHAGVSGGALLCAATGKLVGIIASNSKDVESGASFPHVNFSIPVDCFKQLLDNYVRTGDASCFKPLEDSDHRVASIWALKESGKYRSLQRSKL